MEEECKCKRIVKMAVTTTETTKTSGGAAKKRKLGSEDSEQSSSSNYADSCLLDSPEKSRISAAVGFSNRAADGDLMSPRSGSDHVPASCCSDNESSGQLLKDCLRSVDLEAKGFETENSMSVNHKFSREATPSSEICGDTDEMDSSAKKSTANNRRKSPAAKMPSAAEIDEFFSASEKYEQKRFSEKYNFDVVKDLPLEGRYEWIRLKP